MTDPSAGARVTPPEPQTPDVAELLPLDGSYARMAREGDWRGLGQSIAHEILPPVPNGAPDSAYRDRAHLQIVAGNRLVAAVAASEQPAIVGGVDREELLVRMTTQIEEWLDDEPYDDWWTYQRDYAACRDILAALLARSSAPAEVREAFYRRTSCPCVAAERHVETCPKHGSKQFAKSAKSPAATPAPVEPGSERDCCKPDDVVVPRSYLESWLVTLQHARTFIVSREKMHLTGVGLYDDDVAQIQSVLVISPVPSEVDQ